MNYDELKAAELRALCEEKGIKPSRAKHDMIEDLKARDAADELTQLSQELDLPDEPMPVRSDTFMKALDVPQEAPVDDPGPRGQERPLEQLQRAPGAEWVMDGTFYKEFPRDAVLDEREHESNLRQVVGGALAMQFQPYGPPFRSAALTSVTRWVYGVNIHQED